MNALILLFYRIVTFFTRVPAKTRALQKGIRASKMPDSDSLNTHYINNQSELADIPYGAGNLGLNGCGPIALYNALKILTEDKTETLGENLDYSFLSIVSYLEHKGATLRGRFGTSPFVIYKYVRNLGYEAMLCKSKNEHKLNEFQGKFDAFISLIYNDSSSLKKGLHFICTKKNPNGSFTTHNPERIGDSLYNALNLCSNDEIRHVCSIGIKNKGV